MRTIMASELDPNHFPQIGIELKNCSEVFGNLASRDQIIFSLLNQNKRLTKNKQTIYLIRDLFSKGLTCSYSGLQESNK